MNNRPYSRPERYGHEVQRIIGDIILKQIDTSALGFVTVTRVKMSNDLRLARVYLSVLKRKVTEPAVEMFFKKRAKFIRKHLGSKVTSKAVPELRFYYDETFEEVEQIERIFTQLKQSEPAPE